jgi:hypothetical protein
VVFAGRPAPGGISRVMSRDAHLILASPSPAGLLGGIRQRLWQRRLPQAAI